MAPRDRDPDDFVNHPSWLLDEEGEEEENEENNIVNQTENRQYIAEVRVEERERANREMARNAELQMELRNSVAAMEQMIESQQRIERIQRSLTYLRDLHSRMVEAGVGQESDSEDEEEDSLEDIIDKTQQTRITPVIASNNNIAATVIKRIPTISESSDASMLSLGDDDGEENET